LIVTSKDDEIRERVQALESRQVRPGFTEAFFVATVGQTRIQPNGFTYVTLVIPPAEKYNALPLTDALAIEVTIHAKRKPKPAKPKR
jgi:hypothetical protein